MNYIALLIYLIIVIPYFVFYGRKNGITPVSVFLLFQMTMFYGICFSGQGTSESANKLQYIYCLAIVFFIIGVEFSRKYTFRLKRSYSREIIGLNATESFSDRDTTQIQRIAIWAIIVLSIVLCGLLFIRNGGNLFLLSLRSFFSDSGAATIVEARKNYTDVNGVGYIYQFRAVLLPLLASFILFFEKKKTTRIITIPIFVLMIIFLLGTGQRNAFVYYGLCMVIYIIIMRKEYGLTLISRPGVIILGAIGVEFLIILTITNGRVGNTDNVFNGAIQSLINRVFLVNQESAIVGFNYMDSQGTVWGYDWWKMLEQLLPGKSDYIPVDYISYSIVYGTLRGTNPPCIWGSAWYNFHLLGVTIFPFVLGFLYEKLHKTAKEFAQKDRLYILIYAALCTYLGIWTSGTPMVLFNNGVVTLFILRWICYRMGNLLNPLSAGK